MSEPNSIKINFSIPQSPVEGICLWEMNLGIKNIDAPFAVSLFEVAPGCSTPIDSHEEQECWIIMQGSGLLHYAGEITRLKPKDMVYFEPKKQHQIDNDTNEVLAIYSFYW